MGTWLRRLLPCIVVALAACSAPAAPAASRPSAEVPGNSTAAPPATPSTAPTAPIIESPVPTQTPPPTPTAEPAVAGEPAATIGYGAAQGSAFVPGGQELAVVTEAGLLVLALPNLTTRSFTPIGGGARQIAISPDGRTFAIAQERDRGLRAVLIGRLGGAPERELPGYEPVFSPDGATLAVSEREFESGRTSTRLYRLADGAHTATLIGAKAHFSPDGGLIATTFDANVVVSRADGTEVLRQPGYDAAFSPDGRLLAVAYQTGAAVYPIREGAVDVESILLNAPGYGRSVDFGRDGRLYATIDATLQIWDVATGREAGERIAVTDSVEVAPGGELLADLASGGDGPSQLTVLRVADGEAVYTDGEMPQGGTASLSPDSDQAAVVRLDGTLTLVSAAQGTVASRPLDGYDRAALDAGGLIALGREQRAELWRAGDVEPELRLGEFIFLDSLRELSFDGARLVAEVNRFELGTSTGGFQVVAWDTESGTGGGSLREQRPLTRGAFGFSEMGQPVVWDYDPASGRMAWRDADGSVYLDDGTPESAARLEGELGDVRAIALAPGGGQLAVGSAGGDLHLFDAASRGQMVPLALPGGPVLNLRWQADGRALVARTETGVFLVMGDEAPPARIAGTTADPGRLDGGPVDVSADGATLAVGDAEQAIVYRGGAALLRVPGPADELALSPDGATLVVLRDGRALVYAIGG